MFNNHYGCCEHLGSFGIDDPKCLKRYFNINDVYNYNSFTISICSELFRLKFNEAKINWKHKYCNSDDNIVESILFDIFIELNILNPIDFTMGYYMNYRSTTRQNVRVNYLLCERPKLYSSISLLSALDIVNKNNLPENLFYGKHEFKIYHSIKESLCESLNQLIDYVLRYSKYKSHHEYAKTLKKLIDKDIVFNQEESLIKLNEFILKIMSK